MEVDPLERLQTLEGPRLHVWNVALGQVELGQELETVKRLRADRLDRVAAKREAHEGRGLAVEGLGWNLQKVWLLANLILNRRPVLVALILIWLAKILKFRIFDNLDILTKFNNFYSIYQQFTLNFIIYFSGKIFNLNSK